MIKKLLKDRFIRIGCYILIFLLIGLIVFEVTYKSYCQGQLLGPDIGLFMTTIKDFFQIVFFCVVVTVTILSYLQAKKTLFTPIKTETFKMQIKSFEEILAFFQSKTETDLTHQFDFDFMVAANFRIMFTDYINTFFKNEIKVNDDAMKELFTKFAGGVVTMSFAEKNFHSPEYFEKIEPEKEEEITNPALILEKWKNYEYGQVHYSKVFSDEMDKLTKLIASPLLTSDLKQKMTNFESKVRGNLVLIGNVLTKLSQELPQKFPTAKSIDKLDLTGVWNRYNHEMENLEPDAKEILNYIRQYLKIETLID
jgi:hypothetical protein